MAKIRLVSDFSTKELLTELSKRKEVQYLRAGLYQKWKLIGKYGNRDIELPDEYGVLLITDVLRPSNN
ncbi:hypothetical protein [Secundilactobacillus kimchicus]|uniref:Uncharacterized protein n=1 Tax=Secundilactobacillus kimchicus JCM 15530 TaxID=1302272 RepID=A0A0R1HWS1_9LACO|nr:hypothetical protein [Secundilactobacillus kimchicus]KRK49011.1 hypothetical protein FC96_GL001334 [Secundilactobacillus kimchicus JCM 15530]MBT9671790.1 hypothetical protein [Secundilactobacillus kimchicus]